jgi:hypothetical protein
MKTLSLAAALIALNLVSVVAHAEAYRRPAEAQGRADRGDRNDRGHRDVERNDHRDRSDSQDRGPTRR